MKIICIAGTRPEAIKMAPVILELKKNSAFDVRVLATAQHREMLDQVFDVFGIVPDIDLNIMQPNQSLPTLTARLLIKLDEVLQFEQPHVVLAQGDTTTVMTAALACFYLQIPFGHIEAGLRTWDMWNPFPEEMNRVIAGRLARWHFAPTPSSRANLLAENVDDAKIWITGNTVIDALHSVSKNYLPLDLPLDSSKRLILVTAHRRENFGEPYRDICRAVKHIADRNSDVQILYPVHPNPNVRDVAYEFLDGHPQIILCPPLDYLPFVAAMQRAYIILSDSGGVQEEAPALGKPVLVLRCETERPEAVEAGVVKLVGSDFDAIVRECQLLLDNEAAYRAVARGVSPYGDGGAAQRIHQVLREYSAQCN
jgi:UDP-N-acetylglucosamine 2-epimerase (non-hydrolysing)